MIVLHDDSATVAQAVEEGLSRKIKQLPSWLFYDATGDKIFESITKMPEYYLTACECEILEVYSSELKKHFDKNAEPFDLIELGAGNGSKTELLLSYFSRTAMNFNYLPVDISRTALDRLVRRLYQTIPSLSIQPLNKRYDEALTTLRGKSARRKVFLFLGANIGNFTTDGAVSFLRMVKTAMKKGDQLLTGFDLKKDPRLILAAYDDPHGITRQFNLNLLARLNRELGAQFRIDQFTHYPLYDPETGVTKSYLVSKLWQDVYIEGIGKHINFEQWEVIHTEISQKYDIEMIRKLAIKTGLEITGTYFDRKQYFCNVLFKKTEDF